MVRVRFAPSPTGNLHIGGARTCLFNWLFARHHQGKFILRIEDTDKTRSQEEYLKEILESLKWLGLDWDEGPYFQSERVKIYLENAEKLLSQGLAYVKEGAIIFRVLPETITIDDLIHGKISFDTSQIKDQVLIKKDGLPTYNFACVIDDALLGITHVIRGDDHISNTPKQVLLYKALGFALPQFAHIPLILDEDRARMSKRKGAVAISEYRRMGYLPEAMVNYLALLGWSPGDNREIIALREMIEKFSLEKVNKTASAFNEDKLDWINSQYIRMMDIEKLHSLLEERAIEKGVLKEGFARNWFRQLVLLLQKRIKTLEDFFEQCQFIFREEIDYDPTAVSEFLHQRPYLKEGFEKLIKGLEEMDCFEVQSIEKLLRSLAGELKVSAKDFILPVRVAVTGKSVSPPLFESIYLLGKERTISRIKYALTDLLNPFNLRG
ncbi:MAG: glutamate--tRNA ligase [Candidatus Omnitrophica bacterium]|nr:glutamate--tRNA ligase [Candidatus Omnitrophota bacterium]MCM8793954.1 glutamate--tRNA ligase [Candidatus Omnitrophota bacterium]